MPPERIIQHQTPSQEPGQPPVPETLREGSVSEQAVIDVLKALPIPITIERKTLEKPRRGRTRYYTYQVGKPTPDHPVGRGMGASVHFLDAVRFSLETAMR